jgi:hypothetical protein
VTSGNLNFSSDDVRLGTAGRGEGIMFWGWQFFKMPGWVVRPTALTHKISSRASSRRMIW